MNRFWVQLALNAQPGKRCIASLGSRRQTDAFLDFVPSFATLLARPESPATFERYQPHATIKVQPGSATRPFDATGNPRPETIDSGSPTLLSLEDNASAHESEQVEQKKSRIQRFASKHGADKRTTRMKTAVFGILTSTVSAT